mmetsp:Transcript_31006/g.78576  ORF Transcript_31006/g.78576 Transcript_31006/m.78576 type:complete len:219 (+) Transcript_31006:102-758(+)
MKAQTLESNCHPLRARSGRDASPPGPAASGGKLLLPRLRKLLCECLSRPPEDEVVQQVGSERHDGEKDDRGDDVEEDGKPVVAHRLLDRVHRPHVSRATLLPREFHSLRKVGREACPAPHVVPPPHVSVAHDLECVVHVDEHLLSFRGGVHVGMVLRRHFPVGRLDFRRACLPGDPEHEIWVRHSVGIHRFSLCTQPLDAISRPQGAGSTSAKSGVGG